MQDIFILLANPEHHKSLNLSGDLFRREAQDPTQQGLRLAMGLLDHSLDFAVEWLIDGNI